MDKTGIEEHLINNLNLYIGEKDEYLKKYFGIDKKDNKSTWVELAYKMLGVSSNKMKELEYNNIIIKTIRINKNFKIKESMSFPTIKFKELIKEKWNSSYIYNYFSSTKFLFIVYKEENFGYTFLSGTFWRMPDEDLNNIVMNEWEDICSIVSNNIKFCIKNGKVSNNLPKKSQTKILHLRPKANKAAYFLNNGFKSGNIKKDGDQLPNGEWMTKQCFWLSNDYILNQIKKESIFLKYTINSLPLSQIKYNLLKKYLTKDFYTLVDFKYKFLNILKFEDEKYINIHNIKNLGFRFNFTYVYSDKYKNIKQYIKSLLLSSEIVDLKKIEPKIDSINNYDEIINCLIKELPIYRIKKNIFIHTNRLNQGGITKERTMLFIDKAINLNNLNYFSIKTLKKYNQFEDIFNDGFEDCFYEDILLSSNHLKSFIIGGIRVFCRANELNKFDAFLTFLVSQNKKINIFDLKTLLLNSYGINIELKILKNHLRFSMLYYNLDTEKIYINHNEFIEEIRYLIK